MKTFEEFAIDWKDRMLHDATYIEFADALKTFVEEKENEALTKAAEYIEGQNYEGSNQLAEEVRSLRKNAPTTELNCGCDGCGCDNEVGC